MTYCVAIKVNDGLVFASDTRTSAGADDVRTYNKLHRFETFDDRIFVMLAAGNLATTQAVLMMIRRDLANPQPISLNTVSHPFDADEYVGALSAKAQRDGAMQSPSNVDLRTTLILGGQIRGCEPQIYLIYPEGNCIAASPETPYLQIGESKYGKPILDRVIHPQVSLEDAARCALVSLDSTMKSNLTVGPPIDLAIIPVDTLRIGHLERFDLDSAYFAELRSAWGHLLVESFTRLPPFDWEQPTPG